MKKTSAAGLCAVIFAGSFATSLAALAGTRNARATDAEADSTTPFAAHLESAMQAMTPGSEEDWSRLNVLPHYVRLTRATEVLHYLGWAIAGPIRDGGFLIFRPTFDGSRDLEIATFRAGFAMFRPNERDELRSSLASSLTQLAGGTAAPPQLRPVRVVRPRIVLQWYTLVVTAVPTTPGQSAVSVALANAVNALSDSGVAVAQVTGAPGCSAFK